MSYDGISCQNWETSAGYADPGSDECLASHIVGAKGCGCITDTAETGICSMCPDGSEPLEKDSVLINFENEPTCLDWSTVPAVDGNDTCTYLSDTYAAVCGCEGVQSCEFCLNNTEPADLLLPLFMFRNFSCSELEARQKEQSYPDQCSSLEDEFLYDFAGYCCRDTEPRLDCSLCSDPSLILDVDLDFGGGIGTCMDVADGIAYVLNEGICRTYVQQYGPSCCENQTIAGDTWEPTDEPTVAAS
jgi:hypothetical protein